MLRVLQWWNGCELPVVAKAMNSVVNLCVWYSYMGMYKTTPGEKKQLIVTLTVIVLALFSGHSWEPGYDYVWWCWLAHFLGNMACKYSCTLLHPTRLVVILILACHWNESLILWMGLHSTNSPANIVQIRYPSTSYPHNNWVYEHAILKISFISCPLH